MMNNFIFTFWIPDDAPSHQMKANKIYIMIWRCLCPKHCISMSQNIDSDNFN